MADYEASDDLIGAMKKGQTMHVQGINDTGQPISIPLPLADFAKAFDGPPTDPKTVAEQQKQLQEELQKRAEEARKKLEGQQQHRQLTAGLAAAADVAFATLFMREPRVIPIE